MIPIAEMTEVMKTCVAQKESIVEAHQWVRVNKGLYKDDLGLIEKVIGSKEVLVRLIPRIPDNWLEQKGSSEMTQASYPQTFAGLNKMMKHKKYVKIPQRLFNPTFVKNEC